MEKLDGNCVVGGEKSGNIKVNGDGVTQHLTVLQSTQLDRTTSITDREQDGVNVGWAAIVNNPRVYESCMRSRLLSEIREKPFGGERGRARLLSWLQLHLQWTAPFGESTISVQTIQSEILWRVRDSNTSSREAQMEIKGKIRVRRDYVPGGSS